jgi:hypothetical protein
MDYILITFLHTTPREQARREGMTHSRILLKGLLLFRALEGVEMDEI